MSQKKGVRGSFPITWLQVKFESVKKPPCSKDTNFAAPRQKQPLTLDCVTMYSPHFPRQMQISKPPKGRSAALTSSLELDKVRDRDGDRDRQTEPFRENPEIHRKCSNKNFIALC